MKLKLKFKLDNKNIHVEYRKFFISYFKYCLSDVDQKYFDEYYNNTNKKNFTFSVYIPNSKKINEEFFQSSEDIITLNMSFLDERQGYLFYACFVRQINKYFNIPNNRIQLISVDKMGEKTDFKDCVLVKTLSPICLVEHNKNNNKLDYYYSIEHKDYLDILKNKIGVDIQNIELKKTIVKHYDIYLECTSGIFILNGHPNKIKQLYKSGIGNKTGQGFGMIEIL